MGSSDHADPQRYLASEMVRLGRLIGLTRENLVGFENRDFAMPFIRVGEAGELRILAYERGRLILEEVTGGLDETLYWVFEDATRLAAESWSRRHPRDGEPPRTTQLRRQFAMLHTLRPEWAERRRTKEIARFTDPDHIRSVPDLPDTDL